MSLEIFRKKLLLKYKNKLTKESSEHVTSHFYKYSSHKIVKKNVLNKDYSNQCTLEVLMIIKINSIFKNLKPNQGPLVEISLHFK